MGQKILVAFDVIGAIETIGEWVLLISLETTRAGRVLWASAPTVGSKLTQNTSPRLIETVIYSTLKLLVNSSNLFGRFPVLDS